MKLGTRGSQLALAQANIVMNALKTHWSDIEAEITIIQTFGDRDQITQLDILPAFGAGVFVRELDDALLRKEIDFAVHSLKDIPVDMREGLCIAAVPKRASPNDVLISSHGGLEDLPHNASIGTSSVRRKAEMLRLRPDLNVVGLRGNIDTRLKKAAKLDGIIGAEAAFDRVEYNDAKRFHITRLATDQVMPCPAQGAIGIVCRQDDDNTISILEKLNHSETHSSVTAERSFLKALGGGCSVPIGSLAVVNGNSITVDGAITSLDGSNSVRGNTTGLANNSSILGNDLAENLKQLAEKANLKWK